MKRRTKPEVRPVSRYPVPGYPSFEDPEPKAWLQVNPYPFGGTLAGSLALGALGLLGVGVGAGIAGEGAGSRPAAGSKTEAAPEFCITCADKSFEAGKGKCGTCGGDSGSKQLKHCSKCAGKKVICRMCGRSTRPHGHPFVFKEKARPIKPRPVMMGIVAMPMRLSENDARAVIDKMFMAEGVKLVKDTDPKLKGVTVELDGWDAKKKIGFEYASGNDTDRYANRDISRYSAKQQANIRAQQAKSLSVAEIKQLQALAADKKAYVAVIKHERYPVPYVGQTKELQAKYKELRAAKGNAAKQKALRAEINKLYAAERLKAKQKAIQKLETDVRAYLSWLKKQGAL